MTAVNVPVRFVAEIADEGDVASFLAAVIQSDGTLSVGVCPICFALVPTRKIADHMKVRIHGDAK
jgi:hypothetical protein